MKKSVKIIKMIAVAMTVILMLEQVPLLNVLAAEDTDTTEVASDEIENEVDKDSGFAVEEENEDSDDYSEDSDSEDCAEESDDNSEDENKSDDEESDSDNDESDNEDYKIDVEEKKSEAVEKEQNEEIMELDEETMVYADSVEKKELSSQQIKEYFESQVGNPVKEASCLNFIASGFESMGAKRSTADCAYEYGLEHLQSTSIYDIPIGADVFLLWGEDYGYKKHVCKNGHYCHHIAVYVGDGYIVHTSDGTVVKTLLSDVLSRWNMDFWGWGIHGNVSLKTETSNNEDETIQISTLEIEEDDVCIGVGQTLQLHATVSPSDATDQRLEWVSSATSVATADENGLVTALSPGEATITVRSLDGSGKSDSVIITVEETAQSIPVSTITLSHSSIDLVYGQAQTITAVIAPDDASNKTLVWTSDNESIVRVFGNGILIAGFVEGSATVTAEAADGSGIKAECTVNVTAGEDDIEVSDYFSAIGATDIRSYDAVLFARLSEPMNITEYGVYIGTENSVEDCEKIRMSSLTEVNDIRFSVSKIYGNLTEQTTYYYRFYIITDDIEYYSALGSFKTISSSDDPSEAPMEKKYQRGDIINYGRRAYGYTSWVPKDIQTQLKGASQGFYEVKSSTYYSNGSDIYCTIPVRWIVLEDEGDSLLLISEYVFEGTAFDSSTSSSDAKNWENSEIRGYINNGYMSKTFSDEEMNDIYLTPVAAEGIITYDKLFLPSYDELMEYFDSNDETKAHYYADLTPRITTPISGAGNALAYDKTNYTCAYWTRSSNHTNYGWSQPTYVDCNGAIRWGGRVYNTWNSGIRPMMKIDASSEYISTALTVDNVPEAFEQETIVLETGEYDISGSLSWDELGYPISYRWKANGSGALNSPQFVYFGENTLEASLYGIRPEAVIQQQYIVGICSPDSIRVRRSGPNDEENGVILNWEREADSRNGCGVFEILRSTTPDGDYEQIYQGVVDYSSSRVSDSSVRYSYSYVDTTAEPGGEYWYKVRRLFSEWVSIGKYNYSSESHGYVQECSSAATIGNYVLGDVNNDGKINAADRIYLARYLAGWSGYELTIETVADVNCDNKVNAADRIYLAWYLAGWDGYTLE